MSRHFDSHGKRDTHSWTTHGSHDSSWFEALEILDENDSEYLVRWAGKDPSSGEEWPPSWTLKINCSSALVKTWKDIQKQKNSNTLLPTPITILNKRTPASQPAPTRRTSARLSAAGQPSSNNDTEQSLRHSPRRSTRTIVNGGRTANQSISKSPPIQSAVASNSGKRKFPSPEAPLDSVANSQDMRNPRPQGNWFEALEILAQNGDNFEVSWAGIDPSTGKQWGPTWVQRKDCSPALLRTWKLKQVGEKRDNDPVSIQTELPRLRSVTHEPPVNSLIEKPDLQLFQQVPLKVPVSIDKPATIFLPRTTSSKRKSIFDNVIPAKRRSRTDTSRSPNSKYDAERNPGRSTTEISSSLKEIPVKHKVIENHRSESPTLSKVLKNGTSLLPSRGSAWPTLTQDQTRWRRFTKSKDTQRLVDG